MKKRIFAGLLTLVMVFTLLPVSAMAEAGNWDPLTDPEDVDGTLVGTKSFTAATTFQTGKDGQLKVMPIYQVTSGYTTTTYNAMAYCGAKAASNNTDVVEVKQTDDGKQDICIGKWEGGDFHGADCLQVNVTPKMAGRAVVTISFYYTFSQNSNPLTSSNTKWFNGTMEYTVNVTEPEPDPEVEYTLNYDAMAVKTRLLLRLRNPAPAVPPSPFLAQLLPLRVMTSRVGAPPRVVLSSISPTAASP